MKRNWFLRAAAIMMVCVTFSLCTVTKTVSKYNTTATISGQSVRAGLFRVSVKNGDTWTPITTSGGSASFTVNLVDTLWESSLDKEENVAGNNSGGITYGSSGTEDDVYTPSGGVIRIAPGTGGEVKITVKNFSEVEVDIALAINGNIQFNGADLQPGDLPIQWSNDNKATWSSTWPGLPSGSSTLQPINGTRSYSIWWRWAYETGTAVDRIAPGDSADTAAGIAAGSLLLPLTITAVQND